MKTVFSNADSVIHLWAQQTQDEGRSSNVYFEGATIYSYGTHYPLGLFITNKKGEKAVIINTSGYSVTTTKHIYRAKYATNQYKQFLLPSNNAMQALVYGQRYAQPERIINGLNDAIALAISIYHSSILSDTKRRRQSTLEQWKGAVLSECSVYMELMEWLGLKLTHKTKKALKGRLAEAILVRCPVSKKSDDWQETAFHWLIDINGQKFDYYAGSGHVTESGKPKKPLYDDVLYCLVSDADAAEMTFADWCSNLGYDTDSRKALSIYEQCQQNADKLRKAKIDIAAERERLQDY